MTAADGIPNVSRPEGGWKKGDAVVLLGPSLWHFDGWDWQRKDANGYAKDWEMDQEFERGDVVYVHAPRDPNPVTSSLPSEPCAIRATARSRKGVVLIGPDFEGEWQDSDGWYYKPEDITAWEGPLVAPREQDGDTVQVKAWPAEVTAEDRADVARWLRKEADKRVHLVPQRRDGVDALIRHLAFIAQEGDQA